MEFGRLSTPKYKQKKFGNSHKTRTTINSFYPLFQWQTVNFPNYLNKRHDWQSATIQLVQRCHYCNCVALFHCHHKMHRLSAVALQLAASNENIGTMQSQLLLQPTKCLNPSRWSNDRITWCILLQNESPKTLQKTSMRSFLNFIFSLALLVHRLLCCFHLGKSSCFFCSFRLFLFPNTFAITRTPLSIFFSLITFI